MKVLVSLGVALLCLSQVHGEDKLHSLFEEKVKELKPAVFLADAPTTAKPYNCDANDVVNNGNQLIKNTLDIFSKTFSVVYTAMYPESGTKDCTLGTIRCFLQEFTTTKDAIVSVKSMLLSYKADASGLADKISQYVNHCMTNKK